MSKRISRFFWASAICLALMPASALAFGHDHGKGDHDRDDHKVRDKDRDHDKDKDKDPHSRGQVWKIDERARTATLVTNADLGVYASVVGSAHRLSNGNYHFTAGSVRKDGTPMSKAIEVTADGKIVYTLDTPGSTTYRSNRVADLYTPPNR